MLLSSAFTNAQVQRYTENNGYVKPLAVAPGDTLYIYINTSKPVYDITVYRIAVNEYERMMTITGVKSQGLRPIDTLAYEKGVDWPVSYKLVIPGDWRSGAYGLEFPNADGSTTKGAVFALKQKIPGSYSKVLMLLNDFDWTAYNLWGGKNVYDAGSTYNIKADRVSLDRPFSQHRGMGEFHAWNKPLIKWLETNNIRYEINSTMSVHQDPTLLDNYDVLIVSGHDEYYSRPERLNMERFINRGGRQISLSGNTCWWQVRMEDNDRTMVCYKSLKDPIIGKVDSLATVNWYAPPLNWPETMFLGATFLNGGYVNDLLHHIMNYSHGYGDYTVWNSQHWMYKGTGLEDGDSFGRLSSDSTTAVVGYEVDAALFKFQDGLPVVTGEDKTPLNYRILGTSPCEPASYTRGLPVTMGMYVNKNGGAVFNSASINWTFGLKPDTKGQLDTTFQKVFMNILQRFMQGNFPPEIISYKPYVVVKDTAHGVTFNVNRRNIELNIKDNLKSNDSTQLSLKVSDPYGEKVKYIWYVDTIRRSTDSTFTFIATRGGNFKVTAYVYNSKDTSSISWNIHVVGDTILSLGEGEKLRPRSYFIHQNYPNPFNPETKIKYGIAEDGKVTIELFNILGQKVSTLVNDFMKAGDYEVNFNGMDLPSGTYLYRISSGSFMQVKKMVLLK